MRQANRLPFKISITIFCLATVCQSREQVHTAHITTQQRQTICALIKFKQSVLDSSILPHLARGCIFGLT